MPPPARCCALCASVPLCLFPFLVILPSCTSDSPPQFAVESVRLAERTADGFVLEFGVAARNENPVELPLREITYEVSLDGKPVFRGVRSPEATLHRLGTQTLRLPAAVPAAAGIDPEAPELRYTLAGEVSYITPGKIAEILFDAGVRRPSVSFRQEGVLEMRAKTESVAPVP